MMNSAEGARPSRPGLTPAQRKVFQAVEDFVQCRGHSPSYREIGSVAGLASPSIVSHHLRALERKGYLSRGRGQPRTAVVRSPGRPAIPEAGEAPVALAPQEAASVRLVGRIAAGNPILANEAPEDIFSLPRQLVGEGTLFMLKVAGDSMIGA